MKTNLILMLTVCLASCGKHEKRESAQFDGADLVDFKNGFDVTGDSGETPESNSGTIAVSGGVPARLILNDTITRIFIHALQEPDSAGWYDLNAVHFDVRFFDDRWFHFAGDSCTHGFEKKWEVLNDGTHFEMFKASGGLPRWGADEYYKIRIRRRGTDFGMFDSVLNNWVENFDDGRYDIDYLNAAGEIKHWRGEHWE